MNKIPKQLQKGGINFVLLKPKEKIPFQTGWQNKVISFDNSELKMHLENGGNYGVMGGGEKKLIIVDFDCKEVQDKVSEKLPKTFTVKTGSGLLHKYFLTDTCKSFKIMRENFDTIADIQGEGKQVVGANSIHPNGNKYEVIDDSEIAFINYSELQALLSPFDEKKKEKTITEFTKEKKEYNTEDDDIISTIKSYVKPVDVLNYAGVDTSKNPTSCPLHSSKGGKCLGFNDETIHCFHCDGSWNIFSFIQDYKKCDFKESLDICAEIGNLTNELEKSREKYLETKPRFKFDFFSDRTNFIKVVTDFYSQQPFYYDKSKIWWLWNFRDYRWEMVDEIDLMNAIDKYTQYPNSSPSIKANMIEAFKRVGRKLKPKKSKPTWIQFHNKIIDVKTGEQFSASPDYFITNPIPHKIGESEETPNIDRIFKEWVYKKGIQDESYVKTLYEIASYCLIPSMPLHRIFCFIGEGLNGKGTYLRFIENLVGEENKCATEIEILVSNRFESSKLYKKLVCLAGEIDKGIFKRTKTLKSLSGDDLIRVEFKGKNGFDDHNYAKPLIATNHLPETSDKSKGFYRRWCIVDFPNTFNERKNVLEDIPAEEYENFCRKSIKIIKELLQRGEFTNEGSIEERENKYERHAGSFIPFISSYCEKDSEEAIPFDEFYEKFNDFLQETEVKKKSKVEVGRIARNHGFELKVRKVLNSTLSQTTKMHIIGIKWRNDVIF